VERKEKMGRPNSEKTFSQLKTKENLQFERALQVSRRGNKTNGIKDTTNH
jgi:hypothetical protein